MAASNTSHRLSRFFTKDFCQKFFFWLEFEIFSFESLIFFTIWVGAFCHSLSFWNLSNFELNFVPNQVFPFCSNSIFSVLLQFKFARFVRILVFEFWNNLIFKFFFFTMVVSEFFPNFSFWVFFSQFNLIILLQFDSF